MADIDLTEVLGSYVPIVGAMPVAVMPAAGPDDLEAEQDPQGHATVSGRHRGRAASGPRSLALPAVGVGLPSNYHG